VLSVVVALIGFVAAGTSSASRGKPRSSGISMSARAALRGAAIAIANRHGDSHPSDIEAVRTTHRKAERILDTGGELYVVPPGAPVYVVAMRGQFNCNSCSHPHGATIAPARVITLQFLSLRDLQNVVFGYGRPYPHLKAAGIPVRL
jgi:hypothetical protein